MVNREIVMDYILSCLQDLVENGVEIKPDSDLVNDLGLESIKVMDLQSAKWAREGNKLGFLISRLRAGGSAWSLRDGTDLSCDDPFMCL